jgi:23S rRNA (cytosine1962-C5)-methyltransferase
MAPPDADSPMPRIILKPRRARPFFGRHPWVFAGAVQRSEGEPEDGAEVDVHSHEGQFIARGLFNSQSNIRVRLYCWEPEQRLGDAFWLQRMDQALNLRKKLLALNDPKGACRLVFSEADGLSGLVVDRYADWLVVQLTSLALAQRRQVFVDLLCERLSPRGIYLRTERGIGRAEGLALQDGPLYGDVPQEPVFIQEHVVRYGVDLREGQKTGFFLDQRDNRRATASYVTGRRVLDACCYSGGFALAAAVMGGAREAIGFDVSEAAVLLARNNAALNEAANVRFEVGDAFETLAEMREQGERFGAVVLDPPRFARGRTALPEALRAHVRLNDLAVQLLERDGILVTCSCAAHVTREMFEDMLATVAEQTGRSIQILEARGQAADHPVSVSCLESSYLKCYICRVE